MTIERAAKILDPKTTLEAYAECEYYAGFNSSQKWKEDVDEACRMSAEALREKRQRDNIKCENCRHNNEIFGGCQECAVSAINFFNPKEEAE